MSQMSQDLFVELHGRDAWNILVMPIVTKPGNEISSVVMSRAASFVHRGAIVKALEKRGVTGRFSLLDFRDANPKAAEEVDREIVSNLVRRGLL